MSARSRFSYMFTVGLFLAGSTALGYYYLFFYSPPLRAAEEFMRAMETGDAAAVRSIITVSQGLDSGALRDATPEEVQQLLKEHFVRGRILDQRKREGRSRDYEYLVYREPDGRVYALVAARVDGEFRIVIPETPMSRKRRYLWDYTWTN